MIGASDWLGSNVSPLQFTSWYLFLDGEDLPAVGGFGKVAGGEAPDDDLFVGPIVCLFAGLEHHVAGQVETHAGSSGAAGAADVDGGFELVGEVVGEAAARSEQGWVVKHEGVGVAEENDGAGGVVGDGVPVGAGDPGEREGFGSGFGPWSLFGEIAGDGDGLGFG